MDKPDNIFGKVVESTGAVLLQQLESGVSEGYLSPFGAETPDTLNLFGRKACHRNSPDLSFLAGLASTGLRAGAFLSGSQLGANYNQLADFVRQNLPVLVAGGGGGSVNTGRHLVLSNGWHMADLELSLLSAMGLPLASFGVNGDVPLPLT